MMTKKGEEKDNDYDIKEEERLNNLLAEKDTFSPNVFNASEIDLFGMETRARLKLNDLVQPIIEQVEGERKVRAQMEVMYNRLMARLSGVEKILGSVQGKPKMIEDLENRMVELRSELFLKVAECELHVKECKQETNRLELK